MADDTQLLNSRDATEADYNAASRSIEMKVEIYFDGLKAEPFIATRSGHLIDVDLLEETGADADNPLGTVSSNEVSFSLYNDKGLFSPTDVNSPYYNKIRTGVPVKIFMRPQVEGEDINWQPMGEFYVSNWLSSVTGIVANITANDKLLDIFDKPQVKLPVVKDVTMHNLYSEFFDALGVKANIDKDLTEKLIYGYNTDTNKNFLIELSIGAQAFTFCDRQGVLTVEYARGPQPIKHTLTDQDQIIDILSEQSILTDFLGVEVITNTPQESAVDTILSLTELSVPSGDRVSGATALSKTPLYRVVSATLKSDKNVRLTSVVASCLDILYGTNNPSEEAVVAALDILGTYVEVVTTAHSDNTDKLLTVDNLYIQTEEYTQKFLRFLRAYVTNKVPVLELQIRGNPMYLPGEKLHVISERYNVDFTGILIRQHFKYSGSVSSTIRLFNSEIMEVL